MTGGYAVDPDALGAHADVVGRVAYALESVSAVARPVSAEALGMIGRPFAGSLIEAGAATAATIVTLALSARSEQDGLRGTVDAYQRRDVEQAREFDTIQLAGEHR
ncbi:MAG TPA: type VII secretion target [Pseudonocardia sp.]|nr:type VII secretion target [Pseudonocardia sp.]